MKVLVTMKASCLRWTGKNKEIMKKIYNYFLIAMAAAAVASCAKEIAPETNSGLVFTVQNEKAVVKSVLDVNVTPKWVAEDVISVNGTACAVLDVAAGTFDGANVETAESYAVVYPYAAEHTFAGTTLSASVPAEQTIAAGQNVAQGALVAACISENTTLQFKNCVSLMQINLPVEGVKEIVVTVDGETEVLAGPFTMDLAAETLAPVAAAEGTSKTVTLKAAEGTFAPGTYYAAVLPGTFTGFSVKFIKSADDTQTITNTKELVLERSNGKTLGTIFTYNIGTAEELLSWAKNNAKYTAWDVVNLTEDIALTAEQVAAYVESNEFCGTFNGNNKKITGLTTPLFGNLRGIVRDVEITANIVHDGKANDQFKGYNGGLGILAHYLYNDKNANASVTGVTTRGSIKASGVSLSHSYFIGGVAGASNGVPMTDCANYASISTENVTITGSNYCCVGGVAGRLQTASTTYANCDNYGTIDVQSVSVSSPVFGGVFGQADSGNTYTLTDCDNMAVNPKEENPAVAVGNMTWTANLHMGGVIALTTNGAVLKMTDCDNSAYVKNYCTTENSATGSNYSHLGGILGVTSGASAVLTNCNNSGKIENATVNSYGGSDGKGIRHCVGGIVGRNTCASLTIDNCDNSGEITATSNKGYMDLMGGVLGYSDKSGIVIKNCENTKMISSSSASTVAALAGIAGRMSEGGTVESCTNSGMVYHSGNSTNTVVMGGMIGYGIKKCDLDHCTNSGVIMNESPSNPTGNGVAIGGLIGRMQTDATSLIQYCENTSSAHLINIVTEGKTLDKLDIGGFFGTCSQGKGTVDNCTINVNSSSTGTVTTINKGAISGYSGAYTFSNNKVGGTVLGTTLTKDNLDINLVGTGTVTKTNNTLLQ